MSELKCPYCNKTLHCGATLKSDEFLIDLYQCNNVECEPTEFLVGCKEFWDILEQHRRTRKALGYAINVIQTVAKMSDKLSRKYGETLVEQLDNIQAYCWQEGYVLTHEEDLESALTKLEQNGE